ncbi:hypothetical protein BN8_06027 [Fibrisoma limi BUZ 3]|uniref:Uncharacterized protein n=2 Tax=Fibrisoma limi TaxID=663275 RepID=I2GRW9_9BACT|nr:hypothetical protein BN8_06027 [Fibrisoma limi BUZ 3]
MLFNQSLRSHYTPMVLQQQSNERVGVCSLTDTVTPMNAEYNQEVHSYKKLDSILNKNLHVMKKGLMFIIGIALFVISYYHSRKQLNYMAAQSAASEVATPVASPSESNQTETESSSYYQVATWR